MRPAAVGPAHGLRPSIRGNSAGFRVHSVAISGV